jgi:hypothetical protein
MDKSTQHFGLVAAYLLPGFIALAGIALVIPSVAAWLQPSVTSGGSGIGPPVYAVLAATAVGMTISAFRWLLVDHAHALIFGLKAPAWDVDRLERRLAIFNQLVEFHYRYYQFYANTLIAVLWTYSLNRWFATSSLLGPATDVGVLVLCLVLFFGSRDALAKYYSRTARLIGAVEVSADDAPTNETRGALHQTAGNAVDASG